MTKIAKKNFLFGLSAAVLLSASLTLAYFTATDAVTNTLASKNFDIMLTEQHWNPENAKDITPEEILEKDPKISNSAEVDAYVFLKVTVPYLPNTVPEYNSGTEKGADMTRQTNVPLFKFIVGNEMDTGFTTNQSVYSDYWTLLDGYPTIDADNLLLTYVYAYTNSDGTLRVLEDGTQTTKPLFDKIKVINFEESAYLEGKNYNVKVDAYGIQTEYILENAESSNSPVAVWNILQNMN